MSLNTFFQFSIVSTLNSLAIALELMAKYFDKCIASESRALAQGNKQLVLAPQGPEDLEEYEEFPANEAHCLSAD